MQQHSVPQNIASFKFKLFGSLTARQFFTLITPLSLAAVIFFSPIPPVIRIPISFAIGGFAFFIALVPIGGRPFDKWAVAFIKAVMSPTQRVWIKEKKIPEFLTMIIAPPIAEEKVPEELSSKKREKLMAYLKTLPKDNASPLDVKEQIALQDIDYSIQPNIAVQATPKPIPSETLPPPIIWPKVPIQQEVTRIEKVVKPKQKPQITSSINTPRPEPHIPSAAAPKFKNVHAGFKPAEVKLPPIPIPHVEDLPPSPPQPARVEPVPQPKVSLHAKPYILRGVEKRIATPTPKRNYIELVSEPTVSLASDINYSIDNIIPIRTPDNRIKLVHGIGTTRARKLHYAPPMSFDISKLPIRGEKRFEISDELKKHYQFEDVNPPVVLPIEKKPSPIPKVARQHIEQRPQNIPQRIKTAPGPTGQQVRTPPAAAAVQQSHTPKFSVTDLKKQEVEKKQLSSAEIIPLTKTPNVISGQVVNAGGEPIAGAVLVIRNKHGIPVRALKTNKLGQFLSATPLSDDTYIIETESQLAKFSPFSISLKNQIVPPIAINSEGATSSSK